MTEPDVALTDFALSLESAVFAAVLWRWRGRAGWFAGLFSLYFATASVASLCGGLVHGFFLDKYSLGQAVLWPTTLLAIGLNSTAAWAIGAWLVLSPNLAYKVSLVASVGFVAYAGFVLLGNDNFRTAVWMAVPATIGLFAVLIWVSLRDRRNGAILAAAGLALTAAAMIGQQLRVGLHSVYFNHNAMAHVVQAVALVLFFVGSLRMLDNPSIDSNGRAT